MLTPEQIRPFLQHTDAYVRHAAARYFAEAHDPGSVNAEELWAAVDAYGDRAVPGTGLLYILRDFRQTPVSVARTVAGLAAANDNQRHHLAAALAAADPDLLAPHRDELAAHPALTEKQRTRILARLSPLTDPPEALWERFLAICRDNDTKYCNEFDHRAMESVLDALVRHPEFSAAHAMSVLADPNITDYREVFALVLVGRLKHVEAIAACVSRLGSEDDATCDESVKALARIGTPGAVAHIAEVFLEKNWEFQLYASSALGRINLAESEAALIRVFDGLSARQEDCTHVAEALFDLGTTVGLPRLEQLIERGNYDHMVDDFEERMLILSEMANYHPAQERRWRKHVTRRRQRSEERSLAWERGGLAMFPEQSDGEGAEKIADETWDDEGSAEDVPFVQREAVVPQPFRRSEEKVGRNDPCPCGSGKKYKKCCMNRAV